MADFIAKLIFGAAIGLLLGYQSVVGVWQDEYVRAAEYADVYQGSNDTDVLMRAKQRAAEEEMRAMLKAYEQEDFDFMHGVVYEPVDD